MVTIARSFANNPDGKVSNQQYNVDMELLFNLVNQLVPSGSVVATGRAAAPTGWLLCNGASLVRKDYPELFAAIGTTFGSVDATHFTLPDLRNRLPWGAGTLTLGQADGATTKNLSHTHTGPSHQHTVPTHYHAVIGATQSPSASGPGGAGGPVASETHTHNISFNSANHDEDATGNGGTGNTGSGGSTTQDILPPVLAVNFIIKI